MAYKIIENYVSKLKYAIKCPYSMTPVGITVHNTANDASAVNEVKYMIGNFSSTSYHVAIDDVNVVLAIPFNRNAFHAGDGSKGKGNRKTIGIEICYSKSGGTRFDNAEKNAAKYIATLLKEYGWTTKDVYRHKDFANKNCPHRTMANGWTRFLNMIQAELDKLNKPSTPNYPTVIKTLVSKGVITSPDYWTNNYKKLKYLDLLLDNIAKIAKSNKVNSFKNVKDAINHLYKCKVITDSAYWTKNYSKIKHLDSLLINAADHVQNTQKSLDDWAKEVIAGKHGNGHANREASLKKAGCTYSYAQVKARVNALL